MALINPNSLYTAGAVRVDSSPSVNFYARLQAQKQAKEEAFDQYIQGLGGKLTPTGVRAVDIPEFNDKVQRWKQFVMQNKGNLSKSPELQMQANRLYQDALSIPTWSKQIEEGKKPFVEKALDPKWRQQVNPSVFQDLDATDQPRNIKDKNGDWIPNPKWRPIDYNSVHFREPNFDFGKTFEGWSKGMDLTENIGDVVSRNPVTGTAKVAFEKRFDPTQVKQIAANAARSLADNPDYLDYYTKRLHNISEKEYKELNDIYREVVDGGKKYVRPDGKIEIVGGEIDSPEKLAMADAIKQARGLTQKGTKDILDRDLQNQRSINKIFINQAGRGDNKETPRIDLTVYKKEPEGYNITSMTSGVKFTGLPGGKSLEAKKVLYNPDNKTFTITEYVSRNDDDKIVPSTGAITIPYNRFMQDISTLNPQVDKKFLEGLANPIVGADNTQSQYINIRTGKDANGNKITIGVRNGKWYNIQTNKPL